MGNKIVDERPIADGLYEIVEGEPALMGSRCTECGTVAFPYQATCPRCTSALVQHHRLPAEGTLWTWTTQGFRPKSPPYVGPDDFVQYAVGYVELGGVIRVEGRLGVSDTSQLQIGMPMRLVLIAVADASGGSRATFGFEPLGAMK